MCKSIKAFQASGKFEALFTTAIGIYKENQTTLNIALRNQHRRVITHRHSTKTLNFKRVPCCFIQAK